jgi:hypothetical protein
MKRVEVKREKRNRESKRKKWLRRRGMSPQWREGRLGKKGKAKQMAIAQSIPLRGVKADLRSTLPKVEKMPRKMGLGKRIVRALGLRGK